VGLFDALMGRTKPVPPNLDNLFQIPEAALTIEASLGLRFSGHSGVCWSPPQGENQAQVVKEIAGLLSLPDDPSATINDDVIPSVGTTMSQSVDSFGYHWILVSELPTDALVARVHLVNSTIEEAGYGPQLVCSVFSLVPNGDASPDTKPCYIVYLFKRGTFYPFVPTGNQHRDNEYELHLRGIIGSELRIEPDLARWFPLWDLPVH